jgi:hypothetical protein
MAAWFVFRKTSIGQEWLANQLEMGSRVNVSRAIKEVEESHDTQVSQWKKKLDRMYKDTD